MSKEHHDMDATKLRSQPPLLAIIFIVVLSLIELLAWRITR
jgi:hypothetical protein